MQTSTNPQHSSFSQNFFNSIKLDQPSQPQSQPRGILKKVQFQEKQQEQVQNERQMHDNPDSLQNLLSEVSSLLGQAQQQTQANQTLQISQQNAQNLMQNNQKILGNSQNIQSMLNYQPNILNYSQNNQQTMLNYSQNTGNLLSSQQSVLMDHSMFKVKNKKKSKKIYVPSDSEISQIEEDSDEDEEEYRKKRSKRNQKKNNKKKKVIYYNNSNSDSEEETREQSKSPNLRFKGKNKKYTNDNQSVISSASNLNKQPNKNFYFNKDQDKDDNQSIISIVTQKSFKSAKSQPFKFQPRQVNESRVLVEQYNTENQTSSKLNPHNHNRFPSFNKNQKKQQFSIQSPVKSQKFSPQIIENQDIFCIVCENYVNIAQINQHSQNCKQEKQQHIKKNQFQNLCEINEKISKIKFLVSKIQQKLENDEFYQKVEEYCAIVMQYVDMMLQSENISELSGNIQALKVVTQRIEQFNNNNAIKLFELSEKLKLFCKQKIEFLDPYFFENNDNISCIPSQIGRNNANTFSNIDLSDFNSYQSKQPVSHEFQTIQHPYNNQNCQKLSRQKIFSQHKEDKIKLADFYSNEDWSKKQKNKQNIDKNLLRNYSHNRLQKAIDIDEDSVSVYQQYKNDKNHSNLSPVKQEQIKKRFFDLAVQIKQKYPKNHPSQNVLIAQMYEEVKYCNIQQDGWKRFIQKIYDSQK